MIRVEWQSALCLGLGLLVCVGCDNDAGGPEPVMVGVRILDARALPVAQVCARLPVLLGSVAVDTRAVGGAFAVELRAERHRAEISFPGAMNAAASARTISAASLASGFTETIAVTGSDGDAYSAVILTSCVVPGDDTDP
jgi:hypothetical protein